MMQCKCKEATLEILDPEAWKLASQLARRVGRLARPGRAEPGRAGRLGAAGQEITVAKKVAVGSIRTL